MMYGWVQHRHRTDLPELIVMVDDSASMATVDQDDSVGDPSRGRGRTDGGPSRWERVRQWWERREARLLRELAGRYRGVLAWRRSALLPAAEALMRRLRDTIRARLDHAAA